MAKGLGRSRHSRYIRPSIRVPKPSNIETGRINNWNAVADASRWRHLASTAEAVKSDRPLAGKIRAKRFCVVWHFRVRMPNEPGPAISSRVVWSDRLDYIQYARSNDAAPLCGAILNQRWTPDRSPADDRIISQWQALSVIRAPQLFLCLILPN